VASLEDTPAAIGVGYRWQPRCSRSCVPTRRRNDLEPPRRDPITEAIALRAYELFLARGSQHGRDLEDWLQAERELLEAARSRRITDEHL
jgi:hypothetical protein